MPKLDPKVAVETESAEVQDREYSSEIPLMPDGWYRATLVEVQDTKKNGEPMIGQESGVPYWTWVYQIPESAPKYGKRMFWDIVSLGEKSAENRKAHFQAVGLDSTQDTEEGYGRDCLIWVGHKTIQQGSKAGERENKVFGVKPLGSDVPLAENSLPNEGGASPSKGGAKPKKALF